MWYLLGTPETNLSGLSTLMARRVLKSTPSSTPVADRLSSLWPMMVMYLRFDCGGGLGFRLSGVDTGREKWKRRKTKNVGLGLLEAFAHTIYCSKI